MANSPQLLYPDELAAALRRSRGYVFAMKSAGFTMPGGTATLADARTWLAAHPEFRTTAYYKKTKKAPRPPIDLTADFSG